MKLIKNNSETKKYVIIAVLAGIALFSGAALRIYTLLHSKSDDIYTAIGRGVGAGTSQYTLLKEQGRFNILLMGEDNVEGSRRSDTVLFVMIDINDQNMRIIALPRDTRVEIPRHGYQKLNHAYAYGGADLTKTTVERYLNQPILYYMVVDFDSFPPLIDALGGVEIDVQKRMKYVDRAGGLDIDIQPGVQAMDGKTALSFVRFRKDALGDIGRVQRQQQFMKALLKQAYDPRNIIKIPEIVKETIKLIRTDMPLSLAVQLAGFISNEIGRERIFFSTLTGKPATVDKLSYWLGDVKAAAGFLDAPIEELMNGELEQGLDRFAGMPIGYSSALEENGKNTPANGGEADAAKAAAVSKDEFTAIIKSISEPIAILNGSGKSGIGSQVAARFQKLGVDVVHIGNAKHFDYKYSNVIYPQGARQTTITSAKKLSELAGIPNNLVRVGNQANYPSIIIGHDYAIVIAKLDKMLPLAVQ